MVSEVLLEFYLEDETQEPRVKVTFIFTNGTTKVADTEVDAKVIRFMLESRREVACA
jgi:hypothetical protein